jgi:hypothetical protein
MKITTTILITCFVIGFISTGAVQSEEPSLAKAVFYVG